MVDRVPFEVEAVKTYLRAVCEMHLWAANEVGAEDPGVLLEATIVANTPVGCRLRSIGAAVVISMAHDALFGESILPVPPARNGGGVQ